MRHKPNAEEMGFTIEYVQGTLDGFVAALLALLISEDTRRQLAPIHRKLDALLKLENQEMADLTQITADVAANTDTVASAVALLTQLHDEIVAAGTDPAALAALASSLEANTQALADAVVANTPVA